MKRRLSAVLLALGLTVSAFSTGVYAAEAQTESTEQAAEALTEAEAIEDAIDEVESELTAETEQTQMTQEEYYKTYFASYLSQISEISDEQLDAMKESSDSSSAAIAANWSSVREELGNFVEVTSLSVDSEASTFTVLAKYDNIDDNTDVTVTFSVDSDAQTIIPKWDIDYPMGVLLKRAALNTVMGIAIVFITLLFLSWLIGKLHIIPDMIEKNKKQAAPAPAPAAVPEAAAPVEEEELADDLELVAVITAAIAASENTSSDGFVVRSIKKANKRNWR